MPSLPRTHRPAHLPSREVEQREREQAFDQRRGTHTQRGYNQAWARAADGHRRRFPLCRGCEASGLVVAAQLVDHVEPHKGDTVKFWNKAMWQSSCRWHHDVVKQRLELMWARGEIGIADLWLDSAVALRVADEMRRGR